MKILPAALFMATTAAAPAAASSFVMLERAATQPSPSIILFVEPGAPQAAARPAAPELLGGPRLVYPAAAPSFAAARPEIPAAAEPFTRVSPSVIAMGEPAVEATIVASITPDRPMRDPHLPPMVIRGGLAGDAFVRGSGLAAQAVAPSEASARAPAPALPNAPGQPPQPEAPRAPPPPAPQAPAAPTRAPK